MGKITSRSKPFRIEPKRSYNGRNGMIYVFDIEFDDGVQGEFSTTKEHQTKFTIGVECTYTAEDKIDGRGNDFVKIDLIKDADAGGEYAKGKSQPGRYTKSPEVEASITASVCLDCAALCILKTGKMTLVDVDLVSLHNVANKFFDHIIEKSKGDTQLSINYQSRLKEVVMILMDYKDEKGINTLGIKSSDDVLAFVDKEVAYLQMKMKKA
jgi:hypothetical protein